MGIADFFATWRSQEKHNPTKQEQRDPAPIDWTDSLQVNRNLTYGLYHNQYTGMKLAGALAFAPIAIPVWFMGYPIPKTKNEQAAVLIDEIMNVFGGLCKQIHIEAHRDGTIWVWPHYSAESKRLHWEFITDESVQSIMRSTDTGEVVAIEVAQQLTVSIGSGRTATAIRRRMFTTVDVTETWSGQVLPERLTGKRVRNSLGILPIAFANNADATETRGHSDYERIIYDLKDYHDIDLRQSTTLAKFSPKLVQKVKDVNTWLANNGYDSIADVDVAASDMFMNVGDEETDFAFPQNAHEAYESALKRKFRKIVEGSGIPEICWGIKTEGNHASAEEQMGMLVQYVQDKREQKTEPYRRLFAASLQLLSIARMTAIDASDLSIMWGSLDGLSEKTKAEIFGLFASGVSALVTSAGFTKEQLYALWSQLYPEATTQSQQEFIVGISRMAKHHQYANESYMMALDIGGEPEPGADDTDDLDGDA